MKNKRIKIKWGNVLELSLISYLIIRFITLLSFCIKYKDMNDNDINILMLIYLLVSYLFVDFVERNGYLWKKWN